MYVEEPEPGRFQWVLTERRGRDWSVLEKAASPVGAYHKAMAEGLVALQGMVEDLERGPRTSDEGAFASEAPKERPAEAADSPDPAREPVPSKTFFGFGPAR